MCRLRSHVGELIHRVPREPDTSLPTGANQEELTEFESRLGIAIPQELREWLQMTNGPCIGPGGLFGVGSRPSFLLMEQHLKLEPGWAALGWLPIAGDGVGNYYVLDTRAGDGTSHPVYFLDHEESLLEARYVVASGLWHFLDFLLQEELDHEEGRSSGWPFSASEVLTRDPGLAAYQGAVPLPWEAV